MPQKTELSLEAAVGQRLEIRYPGPHSCKGKHAEERHYGKGDTPRDYVGDECCARHSDHIGNRHAAHHYRHSLRALADIGQSRAHYGSGAEEGAMREARYKTGSKKRVIAGREGGSGIAHSNHSRKEQEKPLQRPPSQQDKTGSAYGHTRRISRNKISGLDNAHIKFTCHSREYAHHSKLSDAESKRTYCKSKQTLFHPLENI